MVLELDAEVLQGLQSLSQIAGTTPKKLAEQMVTQAVNERIKALRQLVAQTDSPRGSTVDPVPSSLHTSEPQSLARAASASRDFERRSMETVSVDEDRIMELLSTKAACSAKQISRRISRSVRQVRYDLQRLEQRGLVKHGFVGHNKVIQWYLARPTSGSGNGKVSMATLQAPPGSRLRSEIEADQGRIIDLLCGADKPLTLAELSEQVGRKRHMVYYDLRRLEEQGLVIHLEQKTERWERPWAPARSKKQRPSGA